MVHIETSTKEMELWPLTLISNPYTWCLLKKCVSAFSPTTRCFIVLECVTRRLNAVLTFFKSRAKYLKINAVSFFGTEVA